MMTALHNIKVMCLCLCLLFLSFVANLEWEDNKHHRIKLMAFDRDAMAK